MHESARYCTLFELFFLHAQRLSTKEQRNAMGTLGTVKLVAQFSKRCWVLVEEIFSLYEAQRIKGQRKSKQFRLPDCKKSNWQFLHNLNEKEQYELLSSISTLKCSFREAEKKSAALKMEAKVRMHDCMFVKFNLALFTSAN